MRGGTRVEVLVVGDQLGEANGAEHRGEGVLVPHEGPNHGLVRWRLEGPGRGPQLARCTIGRLGRHLLLRELEVGVELMGQLLLLARSPLWETH